jgi:pyruvate ferredoxin oxidoreductase gamma subunit/2-oxoisovalerate ferredoxin oxidoreductase gamma subunit
MWVQSFPSFGAERRGAPVSAFLRADRDEITLRCGVQHPDWMVLFDPNLLDNPLITGGANEKTSIVMNCFQSLSNALPFQCRNLFQVDATAIAEGLNLKTTSFSIVNTAMVGAFAGASGLVEINRLVKFIRDLVPIKKEENAAAARQAFETVQEISDG